MTSEDRLSQRARAGRWLREQRQRRGFATAAEFGRAIGVSKEVASNYEVGRSSVPDDRAEGIAKALGLDIITVRRNLGLWVPDDVPAEVEQLPSLEKVLDTMSLEELVEANVRLAQRIIDRQKEREQRDTEHEQGAGSRGR